jgi:hypothetical protein
MLQVDRCRFMVTICGRQEIRTSGTPSPIFGPAVAQKSAEQPAECCQLVHVAHHAQRPEKSPRVSRHVGVQGQRPWDRYHRGNGIYLRSVLSCAQVLPVYNVQVSPSPRPGSRFD